MKLTFDISATEFVIVRDILADIVPPGCRVWVFGSRAKNQVRFNSDLDLALECKDKLPRVILHKLKETFSDSPLPYRVDVLDINGVSENFQAIIRQQAIAFPLAKSAKVPKLRFKDKQGREFPDWVEKRLGDILLEHKTTNKDNKVDEVFSVAKHKGVINQIEHLGRSYAAASISHYKVACPFDVIYTKSPTSDFPFGIIKQNLTGRFGVVSPLYAVLKPINQYAGFMLHNYFESWVNIYNYLNPLVQKGAKNTMSIRNDDFLNGAKISFPTSESEQKKIASFLFSVDRKIDQMTKKKALLEHYKKGVMQKLFSQELRFKDKQGREFPDWVERRLGEVLDERTERNNTNVEMLSVTLANGVMLAQLLGRHDTSPTDKSKYKRVYIGDIVYNSMRMWQGASGVSKYNGIVSPAYTVIKSCNEQHSDFFGYYFKLARVIQTFQRYSQGLASDTWNLKYPALSRIKLLIPSFQEQQKIADFLSVIDRKISLVTTELTHARTFKKGFLQQMFT